MAVRVPRYVNNAVTKLFSKPPQAEAVKTTKETSAVNQFSNDVAVGGASLRSSNFIKDLFNDRILTPHEEMRQCEVLYRSNAYIPTSVELFTDAVLGREVKIKSKDVRTRLFFQNYIMPRLLAPLREGVEQMSYKGNGYIEILRGMNTNMPLNFTGMPRPEDVYIISKPGEVPTEYVIKYKSTVGMKGLKSYSINYLGQKIETIRGIGIPSENIIHLKYGISHIPEYGRSSLASAVSDGKIVREMERDLAVISRFKAIAKWIINVRNIDQTAISAEEIEEIEKYFADIQDFENPIVGNKDVTVTDMAYGGKHENLDPMLTYFTKKITSSMAPSFYILGDITNYAVAQEQKNIFFLRVQAVRDQVAKAINPVLKEIAQSRNLSLDVEINFGEFDFPTRELLEKEVQDKFRSGLITLNEARQALGYKKLEDSIGDAFNFELQAPSLLEQGVENLIERKAAKKAGGATEEDNPSSDFPPKD